MPLPNPFYDFAFGELFDSVLPDFILAFTFFTAVVYAVLSRRFGEQRPAVAMSGALGMALAVGLVSWEYFHGYSVRNLGPVAVGFGVIILGGVIYQSIRGAGGSWAGVGIGLGACLLVGWTLGLDWSIDPGIVQTVITVALTIGILAFFLHRRGVGVAGARGSFSSPEFSEIRHEMGDLGQDHRAARKLTRGFRNLRNEARHLHERPEDAGDIMLQLKRMLPAEGWLTERMAGLREKAEYLRRGHLARIQELEKEFSKLPAPARKKAGRELAARYKELKLDSRLERLDRAVAENERRIKTLTTQAENCIQNNNYPELLRILEAATKLQRHNAKLFKLIEGTETRLMRIAKQAAPLEAGVKNE